MKNILLFANPFGFGPSGKVITIGKYLKHRLPGVDITVCGGDFLQQIIGTDLKFTKVNERDTQSIAALLQNFKNDSCVISSQNRFAIKAAKANKIPCAFLDGLSWFWKSIPEEHFEADIIFWLQYPKIEQKIPEIYKRKIFLVHGISDITVKNKLEKSVVRHGIMMYVGGCTNPLTGSPIHYLELVSKIVKKLIEDGIEIKVATDEQSKGYLLREENLKDNIVLLEHNAFVRQLSKVEMFVGNGGQTSTLESFTASTPTAFFLPINLSQFALIINLTGEGHAKYLNWENYVKIPFNFMNNTEKDAIGFLDEQSKEILNSPSLFEKLHTDFLKLLTSDKATYSSSILSTLGSSGAEDIFRVLDQNWNLINP